jgi:hypothetical protein
MIRSFPRRRHLLHALAFTVPFLLATGAADPQVPPSQSDSSPLFGACYARAFDAAHLSAHPGQRVEMIAVHFQGFGGDLLASVTYRLRYGTKYGFSSDCHEAVEGGFLCRACIGAGCGRGGETFKILWSGENGLDLVNNMTGMLGENPAGGRDYLISRAEMGHFRLLRGSPEDCIW